MSKKEKVQEWASYSDVARELGFSRQWVHAKLLKSPIKKNKSGKIRKVEAIEFIQQSTDVRKGPQGKSEKIVASSTVNGKTPSIFDSQAKKEAAIASLKELELAQKRGELFDLEQGIKVVCKLAASIKDALQSMDERLPAKLSNLKEKRQIKALLKEEHAKALKSLTTIKFK